MPIGILAYIYVLILISGTCIGSFVNCAADRYKAGESVFSGRSHCPICGAKLTMLDLLPVLSFIFLKGKCRHCGAPIPIRCLYTELLGGILFFTFALRYGVSWYTLECIILFSILYAVALIDLDTMEIPDRLLLFGLMVIWLFLPAHEDMSGRIFDGLIGAVALGGGILLLSLIMDFLLKRESLGGGDIKLFALLGFFFGPWRSLLLLLISCIMGLLFAFCYKREGKEFPFGPSIAGAAWIVALFGQEMIDLYLSLFL